MSQYISSLVEETSLILNNVLNEKGSNLLIESASLITVQLIQQFMNNRIVNNFISTNIAKKITMLMNHEV